MRGDLQYKEEPPRAWCPGLWRTSNLSTETVTAALKTKLTELATERRVLKSQIKAIDADMRTLEGAVLILDGHRMGVRTAKPRATSDSTHLSMERGAFTKAVLEVLRDAKQPLTIVETGQAALAQLGLPEDAMARSKIATKVMTAATIYIRKGTLRRVEREGELYRLEVAR